MDDQSFHVPPRLHAWEPGISLARPEATEVVVLLVNLDPRSDCSRFEQLLQWELLSEEERARARRFVRFRDGRRFAVCRGSLRLILGQMTNTPPPAVTFGFGPGGKPELSGSRAPDDPPWPRFNVTHSDELALIAVSLDRELGVDLERTRTIAEARRIVESYFTPAEQAQFDGIDPSECMPAFLRGWTRKEAILKAKGVGLAGLASSYETMFGITKLTDRFSPTTPFHRIGEWRLWEALPRDGYFAALAVDDAPRPVADAPTIDSPPGDPALRDEQ